MKRGRASGHAFMTACPSYEAVLVLNWMSCACLCVMLSDSQNTFVVCSTVCFFQKRMFRIFATVRGSTSLCVLVCASVRLSFWICMLWNAEWLTGFVRQLFGNLLKNNNIAFVRSYVHYIHQHFNIMHKSDFQQCMTVHDKSDVWHKYFKAVALLWLWGWWYLWALKGQRTPSDTRLNN